MEPPDRPHRAEVLILPDPSTLPGDVRTAMAPVGLVERLRIRIAGGWTAKQVWERLAEPAREALLDATERDQRRAIDRVYRALLALASTGGATRTQVKYTMRLNTKGPRDMLVDVFR